MDDLKTIITNLCQSDYLPEWILRLKDNEVLFSPRRNIKPCIKVGDGMVKSSVWAGLALLESYCRRGFANPAVDDLIVHILNESMDLYKNDKEKDPYKKLDSSSAILYGLLDLILSKPVFINRVDFPLLVDVVLHGATIWPFSLVYSLFQAKNVLLDADQKIVFKAYETIIRNKSKAEDYDKYLIVRELILKNPYDYYGCAKQYVLKECVDKHYFDMGAFYEYGNTYVHEKDLDYFWWLKISSEGVEALSLCEDIDRFIKSDRKILNKIGLCLINLNFSKTEKLFFDNVHLFFEKEDFYADLRCLLTKQNASIFTPKNMDIMMDALSKATFGMPEGSVLTVLKNHLSKIYAANGFDVPFAEEKESDLEFVLNFNKGIYTVKSHRQGDVEKIKKSIWDKSIDDALGVYSQLSNGSFYFADVLFDAFKEYLFAFHQNDFVDYLNRFDWNFSNRLLSFCSNEQNSSAEVLIKVAKKVIELARQDESYLACISMLLFAVQTLINKVDNQTLIGIVESIDYRWLKVVEYEDTRSVVSVCINESLYAYYDLLGYTAQLSGDDKKLKEAIEYHIRTCDCSKLKSILASVFPRLLTIENGYALSLINYIFDNEKNGRNLSYPLLAISGTISETLLDAICYRRDLVTFMSESLDQGHDNMGLLSLSQWFFEFYIFSGKYDSLVMLQFEKSQFAVIMESLTTMNYWLEKRGVNSESMDRFRCYLLRFLSMLKNGDPSFPQIDQFIRVVAKTIDIINGSEPMAWEIFVLLFRGFKQFFSDECVGLVEKFKDSKEKEITKILTMYFSSYEMYVTYEPTLITVFNLVSVDAKYKRKAKEWKVMLLDKNPDLLPKLL